MNNFLRHSFLILAHFGGFGLLAIGALDSSLLFLPLGNDLLIIAMSARRHSFVPYYAFMAAAGSVLGCLSIDALSRKGGEKELEKHVSRKRLEYVQGKMRKGAPWALAISSLMPPPFPFTLFVAAAAASNYPRKKLLSTIAVARFIRFTIEGVLAIFVGKEVLKWAQSREFEYAMLGLIAISVLGSAISIYRWTSQAKQTKPRKRAV